MKAEFRSDMRDRSLPKPVSILLVLVPYPPSLYNPDDTIYPLSSPEIRMVLRKSSDLILLSKILRSGYVDSIYALDNVPMELIAATRRGYLPLTLHYYYDLRNDRIVYVKFKNHKKYRIQVKTVFKNVRAHIEHFINTGEYPNVNKRLINLIEKVRYIIS